MRNSMAWAAVPWFIPFVGGLGLLFATHYTSYDNAFPLKLAFYTGFTACMGF